MLLHRKPPLDVQPDINYVSEYTARPLTLPATSQDEGVAGGAVGASVAGGAVGGGAVGSGAVGRGAFGTPVGSAGGFPGSGGDGASGNAGFSVG